MWIACKALAADALLQSSSTATLLPAWVMQVYALTFHLGASLVREAHSVLRFICLEPCASEAGGEEEVGHLSSLLRTFFVQDVLKRSDEII